MSFIIQGKSNIKYLSIVVILAVPAAAGIFLYQQNLNKKSVESSVQEQQQTQQTQTTDDSSSADDQDQTSFTCGDTVTFIYKGGSVTYGTVEHNSECWMDRNLGATQVATAFDNSAAYGDLFQWGRLDDGHQARNSGTAIVLSGSSNPGHSNFIYGMGGMGSPYDWVSPQIESLWQGVSGTNNPCPSGWRIPTEAEWVAERTSWSQRNYDGAFASPLKLTVAGYRDPSSATVSNAGVYGDYWSSTVSVPYSRGLGFGSDGAEMSNGGRATGFSVRCVKD